MFREPEMVENELVHRSSPSAMNVLRGRLIAKIDEVLSQIAASDDTPSNSHIQFEANLVLPQDVTGYSRRVILDSIRIDDLRSPTTEKDSSLRCTASSSDYVSVNPPLHSQGYCGLDGVPASAEPTHSPNTPVAQSCRPIDNSCVPLFDGSQHTPPTTPTSSTLPTCHLESEEQRPPKRRRLGEDHPHKLEQSTIDKLTEGIWEQIHNPKSLAMGNDLKEAMSWVLEKMSGDTNRFESRDLDFGKATKRCQQITTSSRTARAFEVIVQAHWVDCYDARLTALREERPELRPNEHKKMVLTEACTSFSWSEKELRNRMAIWKGYREIKNAAGWSALVFSGSGIYRFCKYRLGFDQEAMTKLQSMRIRAEVAADTLQPQWRTLLSLVGESTQRHWRGHPHDWAVGRREDQDAVPLAVTYKQWDPNFAFQNLDESIVDCEKWGDRDPRRSESGPIFMCKSCSLRQSDTVEENECECFPDLYSPRPRTSCPVQIFRTDNGKNNGLVACCSFERGQAVGEFVGMVTKGLADVDVMQSQAGDNEPYQIWQGRYGNYTRFINHSCVPNCQFQTFSWLGIQRIVVVSNGIAADKELTVDYSGRYWDNLDKICLCGEARCRYKDRAKR